MTYYGIVFFYFLGSTILLDRHDGPLLVFDDRYLEMYCVKVRQDDHKMYGYAVPFLYGTQCGRLFNAGMNKRRR